MFPKKEILIFHAESAVHAGAEADVGYIDNPIQRERATGFPIFQANGVKGGLREFFETSPYRDDKKIEVIFGPNETVLPNGGKGWAGAVTFGEGRTLFFPVRSLAGTFAYITCSSVLARFQRDLAACGKSLVETDGPWSPTIGKGSCLVYSTPIINADDQHVVLEELLFNISSNPDTAKFIKSAAEHLFPACPEYKPFSEVFASRIVVLNDTDFSYFVTQRTEIEPHNRIDDETGTVDKKTGVWYTEYLPSESILYSCVFVGNPRTRNDDTFKKPQEISKYLVNNLEDCRIWMGGNRTTGKGRMMMHFWGLQQKNTGKKEMEEDEEP